MKTGRNSKKQIKNLIRTDNRGFSLVELVIVIAILAIVAGGVGISISTISNKKVTKCASEIASSIERTRVLTLGKAQNDVECIISYDSSDSSYYAVITQGGSEVQRQKVGESPIDVKVYFDGSSTGVSLGSITGQSPASTSTGLHIMFNRSSGAFLEKTNNAGGEKNYCSKIVVTGGSKSIEITTVGKTGKISTK
jgi:prepilin-type N-terminal cleavage/methylation domain-containing protein